jgi:hypothetical protein
MRLRYGRIGLGQTGTPGIDQHCNLSIQTVFLANLSIGPKESKLFSGLKKAKNLRIFQASVSKCTGTNIVFNFGSMVFQEKMVMRSWHDTTRMCSRAGKAIAG